MDKKNKNKKKEKESELQKLSKTYEGLFGFGALCREQNAHFSPLWRVTTKLYLRHLIICMD